MTREPQYQTRRHQTWENDPERWPDDAVYQRERMRGVAWRVYGWEVEADEDTHWSGCYNRTGMVLAVMVGDNAFHVADPGEFEPLDDDDYCHVCGQVGCTHDGRDRE